MPFRCSAFSSTQPSIRHTALAHMSPSTSHAIPSTAAVVACAYARCIDRAEPSLDCALRLSLLKLPRDSDPMR
jgi:hypothetical protein